VDKGSCGERDCQPQKYRTVQLQVRRQKWSEHDKRYEQDRLVLGTAQTPWVTIGRGWQARCGGGRHFVMSSAIGALGLLRPVTEAVDG
jgi:hypothetical protein